MFIRELIIAIAFYFSFDLINRTNPAAFYYNRYIEDSGTFPMNSSSLFHFISLSLVKITMLIMGLILMLLEFLE